MSDFAVGIGANLGDRIGTLVQAVAALNRHPRLQVRSVSSLYESEPVGVKYQPDFINGAVLITSDLPPHDFLTITQTIETQFGRIRNHHWGPRTLDIDILLIGSISMSTDRLTVPHPELLHRRFVLLPLAELVPDWIIPIVNQTVAAALAGCPDSGRVENVLNHHHFQQSVREGQ